MMSTRQKTGHEGKRRVFGWLAKALCAGILVLGFSARLFASQSACLYYGGYLWEWDALQGGGVQWTQYVWDGSQLNMGASDQLGHESPLGSLGACVFNGLVYCFFTTEGTLWYVTVDPDGQAETGPTTIATLLNPGPGQIGAAAAVCGGQIWVFVAGYPSVFLSTDGEHWSTGSYEWDMSPLPRQMLDAVTFYPGGDAPAGIMLVYNNDTDNALSSAIFYPPDQSPHDIVTLPWPPVNPYLWNSVTGGELLVGTSAGFNKFAAGAKAPCIQFYGLTDQGQDGIHQGRWEYNVADNTWTFNDVTSANTTFLRAWPWFDTTDLKGTMRLSHILSYSNDQNTTYLLNPSDWMVPQYSDNNYAGKATNTATAADPQLQNLWTLVGVVLGPPPFAMNAATDACVTSGDRFSWVSYGKDVSTSVTTTSTSKATISVAVEEKIKGGLGQITLDESYAHAWTSSHGTTQTVSVSQNYQFDTCAEENNQGAYGWAIFDAPTLMTQLYQLYAYDNATYLNRDIYATATGAMVRQTAYFELGDPSQGNYPGLFAGMSTFPNSTDYAGWHLNVPNWDSGGSDWTVIFGDSTSMPVLSLGQEEDVAYTQSVTTIASSGNTNSFDVSAGANLNLIEGFSVGVTVGYDTEFTTTTENESTITQSVTCGLNLAIPPSDNPDYVDQLIVQPYWLQATGAGTSKAPWLPTARGLNLPWCITWAVTEYQKEGGSTAGLAAAPNSASGTIVHGKKKKKDTYALTGGHLAWLNADGTETAIPMTADQFDPSKGASVSLNGHVFSADETKGRWVRKCELWKYKTCKGVQNDPFTLKLDLANKTWSFDASSKTLDQDIQPADGEVHVYLDVQGTYRFSNRLKHDVDTSWSHREKKSDWPPYGVHKIDGAYNSRTGAGNLKLKGHIPKKVCSFGDIEIRVNGASADFPLLSMEGFLDELDHGGKVSYQAEGLSFDMDFGTGKWKATIACAHFKSDMAPKKGAIRVQVLLGGKSISDQTFVLQNHTTMLSFNPSP